jgi:CheY-like chemotaxis protein
MIKPTILWADDEIDMLKPHILFLEQKGYQLITATNGEDAIDLLDEHSVDLVFLDENMPGLTGLETLDKIKALQENIPVVMVTKSEEEHIMDSAIGGKIADYLIKPINPNQLLLSIKKNVDQKRLVTEKTRSAYQQEFRKLALDLSSVNSVSEWDAMYRRLVYWDMELENLDDNSLNDILLTQKKEANSLFFKFIQRNYEDWLHGDEDAPLLSQQVLKQKLFPLLKKDEKVFLIVIDNLRFDQLKAIQPILQEYYRIENEENFYSILPTATQYARNALFAGLMPSEIKKRFPDKWYDDTDDEGKNLHEEDFLKDNLKRNGLADKKVHYAKITNSNSARKYLDNLKSVLDRDLNVLVYNFVDMLSHAKTEMEVIKELADNDKAYRSLTKSWFSNSPLLEVIKILSSKGIKTIITTDHGTINVTEPTKLVGDKSITTNLRYKQGRNMTFENKDVYEVKNPENIYLPKVNLSSSYVFAKEDLFFAYPNNYNYYVKYYRNTYQHGGISMEEIIIPYMELKAK